MSDDNSIDLGKLHEKQTVCFNSKATEILYGGAAGGGKSHMMRIMAIIWCAAVDGLIVYIFRRLSDDLVANHMEGPSGFLALLSPWLENGYAKYNSQKNIITFGNGSKIFLAHCQHEKDLQKYQGREIHVMMIDELTHFTEKMYRFLRSRCRLPKDVLDIPSEYFYECPMCNGEGCESCDHEGSLCMFPRIISGTNPGGIGHAWVKREFVDRCSPLELLQMPEDDGGFIRQFIPALLSDNKSLGKDYASSLKGLGSPELVRAMLEGDWNIVAGGALDDLWNYNKHVVPRFKVPFSWRLDRSFDWGSSTPFSVLWFAEADGTETELPDGRIFCPPAGSLIVFHEWYGAKDNDEGLKMSAGDIAKFIRLRESGLSSNGFIEKEVNPGPADNQIEQQAQSDVASIASKMKEMGIKWTKSDKSPNSRVTGLQMVREMLEEALKDNPEKPCIYVMSHCKKLISHLPVLQRDKNEPDKVMKGGNDHDYDALKYRVLASKPAKVSKKTMYA